MAFTVVTRHAHNGGDVWTVVIDVTSYTTNGELITNAALGLPFDSDPLVIGVVGREDNVYGRHDTANDKLILFDETAEIGNGTDVGQVVVTVCQAFT